jgi:nicotinamidase-related amidase
MARLLVCLDMQRAFLEPGPLNAPHAGDALIHSRRLLAVARNRRWTIAHCLLRRDADPLSIAHQGARPVHGFEPNTRELVFERNTLSAYGNADFARLMDHAGGCVVAGLSASLTLLATAMDAFEHGHQLVLAADAIGAQGGSQASAQTHAAVATDIALLLGFAIAAAEPWEPKRLIGAPLGKGELP